MTRQLHESSLETSAQNPTQLKKQIPALRLFISAFQLFSFSVSQHFSFYHPGSSTKIRWFFRLCSRVCVILSISARRPIKGGYALTLS
jgi:hypothetical protein